MQHYTASELAQRPNVKVVYMPFVGAEHLFTRQQAFRNACEVAAQFNGLAEDGYEFFVGIYSESNSDIIHYAVFGRYDGEVYPSDESVVEEFQPTFNDGYDYEFDNGDFSVVKDIYNRSSYLIDALEGIASHSDEDERADRYLGYAVTVMKDGSKWVVFAEENDTEEMDQSGPKGYKTLREALQQAQEFAAWFRSCYCENYGLEYAS